MDYLAQAQKEIELAQTMVQNGIYPNIDDALKEIRKKKAEENQVPQPAQMPPQSARISQAENSDAQYAMAKRVAKVEQVLQDFGKFFVDYKTSMEKNMKSLQKELISMQSKISNVHTVSPNMEKVQAKAAQVNAEAKQESPVAAAVKSEEKPAGSNAEGYNQRQGNFNSTDVKIEDFFSNANGRMDKLNK